MDNHSGEMQPPAFSLQVVAGDEASWVVVLWFLSAIDLSNMAMSLNSHTAAAVAEREAALRCKFLDWTPEHDAVRGHVCVLDSLVGYKTPHSNQVRRVLCPAWHCRTAI